MGAALGHITRLTPLAHALSEKGHDVTFILNDPALVQAPTTSPKPLSLKVVKAPIWARKYLNLPVKPQNISEVLIASGYYDSKEVSSQLAQWQQLLLSLAPDLIIFDYSPTAILASRGMPCKKLGLDEAFSSPPPIQPLPPFARIDKNRQASLVHSDKSLVDSVNQGLNKLDIKPIDFAHELFEVDKSILLSIPELDPYVKFRTNTNHFGPMTIDNPQAISTTWSECKKTKKVLGYLKPNYPMLEVFLECLHGFDVEANIFIPKVSSHIIERFSKGSIRISNSPYKLSSAFEEADTLVCHGGTTTTASAIMHGLPVLIIPHQQEQLAVAQRCINEQLGVFLNPHEGIEKITLSIKDILESPVYMQNAQKCRAKYQGLKGQTTIESIAGIAEGLLQS